MPSAPASNSRLSRTGSRDCALSLDRPPASTGRTGVRQLQARLGRARVRYTNVAAQSPLLLPPRHGVQFGTFLLPASAEGRHQPPMPVRKRRAPSSVRSADTFSLREKGALFPSPGGRGWLRSSRVRGCGVRDWTPLVSRTDANPEAMRPSSVRSADAFPFGRRGAARFSREGDMQAEMLIGSEFAKGAGDAEPVINPKTGRRSSKSPRPRRPKSTRPSPPQPKLSPAGRARRPPRGPPSCLSSPTASRRRRKPLPSWKR